MYRIADGYLDQRCADDGLARWKAVLSRHTPVFPVDGCGGRGLCRVMDAAFREWLRGQSAFSRTGMSGGLIVYGKAVSSKRIRICQAYKGCHPINNRFTIN